MSQVTRAAPPDGGRVGPPAPEPSAAFLDPARSQMPRPAWLLAAALAAVGGVALALSSLSAAAWPHLALALTGAILLAALAIELALAAVRAARSGAALAAAASLAEAGGAACFLADADGVVLRRGNVPGTAGPVPPTVAAALERRLASTGATLARLQAQAARAGRAREEVATRRGRIGLAVHRVDADRFVWTVTDGPERPFERPSEDPVPAGARPAVVPAAPPVWAAIEDLPVPLLKVARTGEVLAANREARALLPMPIGPGARLSELLEGLGRSVIEWLADVAQGRPAAGPQFLRGAGAHQDTFLRVALSPAGPAEDPHLVAVLNDVTELKSLEAQFVQSQKMQAIGQLAGGVAHDFNNLLTAISGHCDLLLLRHDQGDGDYADLIQIHQNANRAASLVGQLLAFSRKQNLMPETLDLRDTLADLTHLLNRLVGERVSLTLDHDPLLRPIRADKRQLEQVVMNLVVNARDAMPDGGEIRIETENRVLPQPVERDRATVPAGSYVLVRVTDEGTGIPPDSLPKIFEPFYTTKRPGEGTGLGLSTAYGIVKQTGGFIFADSEVGRGTVFTLWLPAHERPAPPAAAPQAAAPLPARAGSGVILLVEDEGPVRAFASRALRLRGYTVLEADSAEAALHLLSDPAVAVDLFVTDVIMPGKDGPTWVREALAQRPDTKVVFVSGYAEDAFAEHKGLIPNSVFLPKPFSLVDLTATVQDMLG